MKAFTTLSQRKRLTLIELMISLVILSILASAVLPLSRMTVRRSKELELRKNLREIRTAIDRFKKDWDDKKIVRTAAAVADEMTGYPQKLDVLVSGGPSATDNGPAFKYLRRVPRDPFTGSTEWGFKCYEDAADSTSWCGKNVYDVYSQSDETAIDGSHYADW